MYWKAQEEEFAQQPVYYVSIEQLRLGQVYHLYPRILGVSVPYSGCKWQRAKS